MAGDIAKGEASSSIVYYKTSLANKSLRKSRKKEAALVA